MGVRGTATAIYILRVDETIRKASKCKNSSRPKLLAVVITEAGLSVGGGVCFKAWKY